MDANKDERVEDAGVVETVVGDLMEDPDAPEKGNTGAPQTTDAEPADERGGAARR